MNEGENKSRMCQGGSQAPPTRPDDEILLHSPLLAPVQPTHAATITTLNRTCSSAQAAHTYHWATQRGEAFGGCSARHRSRWRPARQ